MGEENKGCRGGTSTEDFEVGFGVTVSCVVSLLVK